ncbi:MATE family efflux transporter [Halomicronema sp. CCY15110]|uniref:MATE family efflux transporter n=1 Tax=Halomicronema sp. CCY15110 TaxID=2767773 RepID=UPI001EF1EDAA|nr:MATE family efflux transporter [Halomicronema sp. CCY15110]
MGLWEGDKALMTPFLPRFGRLAIANIVSNLMVPLAGIIDTAFLGHLADVRHLGGVAIASVIFNLVYWSFGFLRMGTTGLTAQAFGRRDTAAMNLLLLRNGLLAVVLGLLIVMLQGPIREIGFWLLNAEPDVRLSGEAFFNARIWGAPAVLANYVLLGRFLGCGQGRRVVLLSVVGNGGNILLDYWFIRELGWESAGAGAATAISQGLMFAVGLGLLLREVAIADLWQLRPQLWDKTALTAMVQLNRDIMVRTFALLLSFALFTNWSSALGSEILAANTLLLQVVTLTSYFIDGLAFATETFAGQFYGAGAAAQLRTLLVWGLSSSVVFGMAIALTFSLFTQPLFRLMTQHQAVIDQVQSLVWWLVPTLTLGAIAFLLDGYFIGLTQGHLLRNSTLLASGLGFLPLGLLARHWQSPAVLWMALASFMTVRALTLGSQVARSLSLAQAQVTDPDAAAL